MALPTNRTTADTAADHVADHNTLHDEYNTHACLSSGTDSTAIGTGNAASTAYSVSVGSRSGASTGTQAIAIGGGVSTTAAPQATAQGAIAIGSSDGAAIAGARASGANSVAIGSGDSGNPAAIASGAASVAIGWVSSAAGQFGIGIGRLANAAHNSAVAIGSGSATTAANQIMLGTASEQVMAPGGISIGKGAGRSTGRTTNVTIANTETMIVSMTVAANTLVVGSTFRLRAMGLWTNTTAAATSVFRVRVGINSLTGNIAAGISAAGGTTARTNIPFVIDAMVTVLSTGGSGTVLGAVLPSVGNVIDPVLSAPVTAAVAVDTTAAKFVELTFISGATTTSITVLSATIIQEV